MKERIYRVKIYKREPQMKLADFYIIGSKKQEVVILMQKFLSKHYREEKLLCVINTVGEYEIEQQYINK